MSDTASGKLRGNQQTNGICIDMTYWWRTHQIPTAHTNLSHTTATTALQLNPHHSFYFGYTYQSLFGFLVHRTPRITPHLPVTHTADERSNRTKLFRNANCLWVQLWDKSATTVQDCCTTRQSERRGKNSYSSAQWQRWLANQVDNDRHSKLNSPTLTWSHGRTPGWTSWTPAATNHHLHHTPGRPTCQQRHEALSTWSTGCAHTGGAVTFQREYAATHSISHSLKYKLHTQDPSSIRKLRLSLPVATLRMCGRSPE